MSLPERPSTRLEILAGRWLAVCVHPEAAWRSRSRSLRLLCVSGYFAGGYIVSFLALQFL
jgi:hypothetical protein